MSRQTRSSTKKRTRSPASAQETAADKKAKCRRTGDAAEAAKASYMDPSTGHERDAGMLYGNISNNNGTYTIRIFPNSSLFVNLVSYCGNLVAEGKNLRGGTGLRVVAHTLPIRQQRDAATPDMEWYLEYGTWHFSVDRPAAQITVVYNGNVAGTQAAAEWMILQSTSKDAIIEFCKLADIRQVAKNQFEILQNRNGRWSSLGNQDKRNFDTVIMESTTKAALKEDLDNFLSDEVRLEYERFSRPYRRSYLFYGPTGMGKTSTIVAMASVYNLKMHILSIDSRMTDNDLTDLINAIGPNSMLLIEDVDSLLKGRGEVNVRNSITFSGLINALDGAIHRCNGLVLVMTTNNKEKLGPSMLRPGRIDYHIDFGYATMKHIEMMYRIYFPDHTSDTCSAFTKQLRNIKTTIAILQEFFFRNRKENTLADKVDQLRKLIKFVANEPPLSEGALAMTM
jgi:hypothetical protein